MQVSYNLRYQKFNFSNRVLLDKEGEVVIYEKGFRLKGKGANDKGDLINFSEIKEFYFRDEKIYFITFAKSKFVLSDAGSLFDQLLIDIYKSRNQFLMDALFMKSGRLKAEFDGNFERLSKFGRPINKGTAKIRLYEGSMVIIPQDQDAFALHYNFVSFHEFDELEYKLKLVMDDGMTVLFSQFGNDYELFEEKLNVLLGGMYESLVNEDLKGLFPQFHSGTLLELAYLMKGGKGVSLKAMRTIDEELADAVSEYIFSDENLKAKIDHLMGLQEGSQIYFGIARDEAVAGGFIKWLMVAAPEKNVATFTILPRWEIPEGAKQKDETYFYKIIMEKGTPAEKLKDKINEINQALVNLSFVKDPCHMDKRELRHSPYQYAIRKLPYLRILRKSYAGKASAEELTDWKAQADKVITKMQLATNVT